MLEWSQGIRKLYCININIYILFHHKGRKGSIVQSITYIKVCAPCVYAFALVTIPRCISTTVALTAVIHVNIVINLSLQFYGMKVKMKNSSETRDCSSIRG